MSQGLYERFTFPLTYDKKFQRIYPKRWRRSHKTPANTTNL